MRLQNRSVLILLALLTLGTNPASTQSEKETPARKDGEETNPYVKRFQELDADRDGFVSLAEWPLEEAKFHIVDRNKGRPSEPNRAADAGHPAS